MNGATAGSAAGTFAYQFVDATGAYSAYTPYTYAASMGLGKTQQDARSGKAIETTMDAGR